MGGEGSAASTSLARSSRMAFSSASVRVLVAGSGLEGVDERVSCGVIGGGGTRLGRSEGRLTSWLNAGGTASEEANAAAIAPLVPLPERDPNEQP